MRSALPPGGASAALSSYSRNCNTDQAIVPENDVDQRIRRGRQREIRVAVLEKGNQAIQNS
jgi:hypothetical protein